MFPYFEIFGKTIGSYGLCAIVGLLLCGVVGCLLARRYQVAYEDIILVMVVIGVSLMIGGHILFGITNTKNLIALFSKAPSYNLKQIFAYLVKYFGGMVFYGGFLGACAGLLIYTKFSKAVERWVAFDLFAVCIPLFHVFGRIGCFLSGCCYGMECRFGVVVHGNTLVPELNDVRRLPVPLIEAVCNLVIFLILLRVFLKGKEKGMMIFLYMLIYPVVRFILEFFRGDAIRGFLFGLSTSQWISIALFAVAVWKLFLSKNRRNKKAVYAAGAVLLGLMVAGATPMTVYAETEAVQEVAAEDEEDQALEESTVEEEKTESGDSEETTGTGTADSEEVGFNSQEKFIIFTCCLFSVAFCLVVALWGNPNDRLKDKYKRARKQQMLEEKKRKEKEDRIARRAAAEAKYAEEVAQYEAELKAYEEEKAAKAAAKAAKKAEKQAKKK